MNLECETLRRAYDAALAACPAVRHDETLDRAAARVEGWCETLDVLRALLRDAEGHADAQARQKQREREARFAREWEAL